jgi:hypothetical protein
MRTARRVIVLLLALGSSGLLLAQQAAAPAPGSVDTDLTVLGRDDSILPVPEPGEQETPLFIPPVDATAPDSPLVPPISPPIAAITTPPADLTASMSGSSP